LPEEAFEGHRSGGWVIPGAEDEPGPRHALSDDAVAYAEALVHGVQAHQADIDVLIARYADRWAIQRMPVVDRTLLRIAMYELLWRDDIPVAVAINEAVELAKELSTEDSGRFINGLLGKIVEREQHQL
jgi:transcription antitermination factor NusB